MRSQTIRDRFSTPPMFGRAREMEVLKSLFDPAGPVVVLLHGVGGVGKTTLLQTFSRSAGCIVHSLDGTSIEPTAGGFLSALGWQSIDDAARGIAAIDTPVLFTIDNYEALRLIDSWLRMDLLPALPVNARFVFAGRSLPVTAWLGSPGWSDLVKSVHVNPLSDSDAESFLRAEGAPEEAIPQLKRFAKGHPLALRLSATAWRERPSLLQRDIEETRLVDELARSYVADIQDPELRRALEAACVVRRVTRPLLKALVGSDNVDGLQALSFVETTADGIVIHEAVRYAIDRRLQALDPERYRQLQTAAWNTLQAQLRAVPSWRYNLDLLFLLQRPEIREAFFPSGESRHIVERATPRDADAIFAITEKHENRACAEVVAAWWRHARTTFSVVRDDAGLVCAFYVLAVSHQLDRSLASHDPVLAAWLPSIERIDRPVLLQRRFLSRDGGENGEAEWSASILDVKRAYLDNPNAAKIVVTATSFDRVWPALSNLGFERNPELTVSIGETSFETISLDFGPKGPVDWMIGLVGKQVGGHLESDPPLLNVARRSLIVDGREIALTKLEFGLLAYLCERKDTVVSRDDLLRDVWHQPFGGSNVVDAVVRTLRKKLGPRASSIETLKGHGYRYSLTASRQPH